MSRKIEKSEAEWRAQFTPAQFQVTREKGTERAFTGEYWDCWDQGEYRCIGCGAPLFRSEHKFDAGCGWPSFWTAAVPENVETADDRSHFMQRTEVLCHECGATSGTCSRTARSRRACATASIRHRSGSNRNRPARTTRREDRNRPASSGRRAAAHPPARVCTSEARTGDEKSRRYSTTTTIVVTAMNSHGWMNQVTAAMPK